MELEIHNRQRKIRFHLPMLRQAGRQALDDCRKFSGDERFALNALPFVEISVVSDAKIARLHQDFMNIPGATDVMTFGHGEIVMSAETAACCAMEHGHSVEAELALYLIHGLLHLNGFDDRTPGERRKMFRVQEKIWRKIMAALR